MLSVIGVLSYERVKWGGGGLKDIQEISPPPMSHLKLPDPRSKQFSVYARPVVSVVNNLRAKKGGLKYFSLLASFLCEQLLTSFPVRIKI